MDRKDLKNPVPVTATSKLSKKPKIIEIDLRSQKLGSPKRYHSQGGSPPQSVPFGTIEPQITTQLSGVLDLRIPPIIRIPPLYRAVLFQGGILKSNTPDISLELLRSDADFFQSMRIICDG